jgi:predicted DNA-binding antitoxin AbrB/MazE fold protein
MAGFNPAIFVSTFNKTRFGIWLGENGTEWDMVHKLNAIYEDGVLKPVTQIPIAVGDLVEVTVVSPTPEPASRDSSTEDSDTYDILEALNANRLAEGARPLIPPKKAE